MQEIGYDGRKKISSKPLFLYAYLHNKKIKVSPIPLFTFFEYS